jgi:hypothetical protein
MTHLTLYYVVMCKHGEILYSEAGPFHTQELAEDSAEWLNRGDKPHGACHRMVATSKVEVELS